MSISLLMLSANPLVDLIEQLIIKLIITCLLSGNIQL